MYFLFPAVFVILILFLVIDHRKKQKIICRISNMSCCEKACLLNLLAEPFGFSYDSTQDIFTSRTDAWQKSFGYGKIYDHAAPSMNMVFDAEPVYFNYQKKTWLIQFWKGQYGINTGAEAGVYHADSIIPPALRSQTLFRAAEEEEMLPMQIRLFSGEETLFCCSGPHWWLTGFDTGRWTPPSGLEMEVSITFPDAEMCSSFLRSLTKLGYKWQEICLWDTTVRFLFTAPKSVPSGAGWRSAYALWKNRIFCRFYQKITAPFCCTADRLLYLYYYLPFAFRKTICPHKFKKQRRRLR